MNALGNLRLLDQQVDKSLWAIEPTEAAKYQFIWDRTFSGSSRRSQRAANTSCRRPREDDEYTLTSSIAELPRDKKCAAPTESSGGGRLLDRSISRMQQVYLRGVKTPRKQMRKLLQKAKTTYIQEDEKSRQHEYEAARRSSESTLVDRMSHEDERIQAKE